MMDGKISTGFENRVMPDLSVSRTDTSKRMAGVSGADGLTSDFASTLKDAIRSADTLQKDADIKMQQLATGKSTNIHETMIATEKADIALRLMVQVRNKIIEAYQEIMKMQV
jgi:flagellar hook-basal body complex protein FliE